ncbi:MAG: hypothetical protein ACD_25C00082G0001 [uncultured bacterium]|nr:MAG: hypothetical protein ACD_25C00082G0001 [uncultured bacterium]
MYSDDFPENEKTHLRFERFFLATSNLLEARTVFFDKLPTSSEEPAAATFCSAVAPDRAFE